MCVRCIAWKFSLERKHAVHTQYGDAARCRGDGRADVASRGAMMVNVNATRTGQVSGYFRKFARVQVVRQ